VSAVLIITPQRRQGLFSLIRRLASLDQGYGLVEIILFATPLAFRPSLTEVETAKHALTTEVITDFNALFQAINDCIDNNTTFTFHDDAQSLLRQTTDQFVSDVNEAITEGKVPPKSKIPETNSESGCWSSRI